MNFKEQMEAEKARIQKLMHDTYIGSCVSLCDAIIDETPIDTGALKGAWHTSTNQEYITDENPRITDVNANIPKDEVRLVFNTVKLAVPVFFTNGMSYSEKIEFGGQEHWQKPNGMVWVTMQRWPAIVAKFWSGTGRTH